MIVDCLMHVHSSFSYDSETDLRDIAALARANGIACLFMSEHNNFMTIEHMEQLVAKCAELSDERLLVVPGLELALDQNRVHVLAYGVTEFIDSRDPSCTIGSLLPRIRAQQGIAVLAHPSQKGAFGRVSLADVAGLDGLEIWNIKNGNRFCPDAGEIRALRATQASRPGVTAFAGVDLHSLSRFMRLVARVETPSFGKRAIIESLRAGRYQIRAPWLTVSSAGESGTIATAAFAAASRTLKSSRRTAYRIQAALERRGVATPRFIAAVGRRLF